MFTIGELLKLADIKGLKLVAGAGGLEKEISRTNIMDNPDTYDWLIAGEFLLSTGYIFREDEALQRRVVRQLAEIGCSGLGLKVNRYLDGIPECMRQEAEALDFPLVELPYGYSLSTVGEIVSKHIYQQREDKLARAMAIHRALTEASLRSGSLREIARIAVGSLDDPVLIFDSNWRLLAWEDCPKNPIPLEEALSPKQKAAVLPRSFTDSMPDTLDRFRKPITRRMDLPGGRQVLCRVMPVAAYDRGIYGYILVWETVRALDAADHMVLEQVAVSAAIERIRARELEEIKVRLKRDFFDDLLSGNIESLSALRSLAELHGLKPESRYRCLLVRFSGDDPEGKLLHQHRLNTQAELCVEACGRVARNLNLSVVAVPYSVQAILLLEAPQDGQESDKQVRRYSEELHEALEDLFPEKELFIVVSSVVDDITHISEAFDDVQRTAKMLRGNAPRDPTVFVEDYSVFYLLDKYIDRQNLAAFAQKCLGELIAYDKENGSQLLETLDTYFAMSGNITEVAKHMYIHRNTCIYRIGRIKSILRDDFSNPLKLLKYQVALLALKVIGK